MGMFFKNKNNDGGSEDARRRYDYDDSDDELLDDLEEDEPYDAYDSGDTRAMRGGYDAEYVNRDTGLRGDDVRRVAYAPEDVPLHGTRYDPDDLDEYKARRSRYSRHLNDETENVRSRRYSSRDDDDEQDYFTGPDIPDPPKKKVKAPVLKPEDPDYWEGDESEWEHLRPDSRFRKWLLIGGVVVIIVVSFAVYLRYFSPYREAATQSGYVESIDSRGKFFKTIEGVLLPYKNLMDTTRVYDHDFVFTVKDTEVAKTLYHAMKNNQPVFVTYKEYSATVPWRGETRIIVTAAEEVSPSKLLPPDRQPELQ